MSSFSKGSIKQQFATGLTAALLLSGANASFTGAQALEQSTADATTDTIASSSVEIPVTGLSQPVTGVSPATMGQTNDHVMVYPHAIDGRQAATLYVKDIPVLTFIGTEIDSLSNGNDAISLATSSPSPSLQAEAVPTGDILDAQLENDPVLRANAIGEQLNPEQLDASALSVRWQEETDGYIVTLGGEDLIALNSRTILADTTEDPAEDALQVTNRLRRLLGDVAPVEEIEGLPEPEPEPAPVVAAAPTPAIAYSATGGASWYGPGFQGRLTANGEYYDQYGITAAHRTLPFGTRVLVTNLYTGLQVTVRINDRGPYAGNRIIDLSRGAADAIGLTSSGVGTVQLDVLY